eukprot:PRCOL_00006331-RA
MGRCEARVGARRAADGGESCGPQNTLPRETYTRLLIQSLSNLGYADAARALQRESGVAPEGERVAELRRAVLAGEWDDASRALADVQRDADAEIEAQKPDSDGAGARAHPPAAAAAARFALLQQKYLEALYSGDTAAAMRCLRQELAPAAAAAKAAANVDELALARLLRQGCSPEVDAPPTGSALPTMAQLALCMATKGGKALERSAAARMLGWKGAGEAGRMALLDRLRELLPPHLVLPEQRLEELLESQLATRQAACPWVPRAHLSLLTDATDSGSYIPNVTAQVLEGHTDEVWHLQFSHGGTMLATASKDASTIIWDVRSSTKVTLRHRLVQAASAAGSGWSDSYGTTGSDDTDGGAGGAGAGAGGDDAPAGTAAQISYCAWSPDDSRLLTCGNDKRRTNVVKMWDSKTGALLRTFAHHSDSVTAVAWMPGGTHFFSGSLDKKLIMWDANSGAVHEILEGKRVNDLAVSADGNTLVSIVSESSIQVLRLDTRSQASRDLGDNCTSLSMSADGRSILVNLSAQEVHLYDLARSVDVLDEKAPPVMCYRGQKQGRYVIRSCFGGRDESFVVSGSEDSQVYVWNRATGELLDVLAGHSGTVNAVAWNPADPYQFVMEAMSASADEDSPSAGVGA